MPEMPSDVRAQPIFWFTRNFGLHEILGILEILGCTYWLLKKRKSDVVKACLELQFLHQPQSFISRGTCHHLEEKIASNQDK